MAHYGNPVEHLRVVINGSDSSAPSYSPVEVSWRGNPVPGYLAVELRIRRYAVQVARIVRAAPRRRGPALPGEEEIWADMRANGVEIVEETD